MPESTTGSVRHSWAQAAEAVNQRAAREMACFVSRFIPWVTGWGRGRRTIRNRAAVVGPRTRNLSAPARFPYEAGSEVDRAPLARGAVGREHDAQALDRVGQV